YFVQAAGFGSSTGGYILTLTPVLDDFGNTFDTAQPLTLAPTGPTTQEGAIDFPGDVDVFQFTALSTGTLNFQQQATLGSSLDSLLTVFDGTQPQIASNDNSNGTLDSQVVVSVTAGQTYFIQAASSFGSTGRYVVTLTPVTDDLGNNFATAQPLTLTPANPT